MCSFDMREILSFVQRYGTAGNRQVIKSVESSADLDTSGFDERILFDHQVRVQSVPHYL